MHEGGRCVGGDRGLGSGDAGAQGVTGSGSGKVVLLRWSVWCLGTQGGRGVENWVGGDFATMLPGRRCVFDGARWSEVAVVVGQWKVAGCGTG